MALHSLPTDRPMPDPLAELIDRAEITRLVNDWGLFRDTGRWDRLRALFAPGATMHTTWFAGPAEEFVERSIAAAARGARAQHFIGAATIELAGDRAIAETRMILMLRATVADIPVDVTCYGRFYDQLARTAAGWRIAKRVPIYEKDRLDPLEPGRIVPLDTAVLAGFAEGYRHLAYVQSLGGATLTPGLPTPNSPEESALHAEGTAWLANTEHSR
jgi:hypothetical protein